MEKVKLEGELQLKLMVT